MAKVAKSKQVATPPAELWGKIGDFQAFDKWFPGVQGMTAVNDGKAREIALGGGMKIVEELVEEGELYHKYRIVEGPLPITGYLSTLRVRPDGDGSIVEWEAEFEPAGVPEDQAVAIVEGVYDTGLAAL